MVVSASGGAANMHFSGHIFSLYSSVFKTQNSQGTKVAYRAKTHIFLHPKGIRLEICILID